MFFIYDKDYGVLGENRKLKPNIEAFESPIRIRSIWSYLESLKLVDKSNIQIYKPKEIDELDLLRVHSPYFIGTVKNMSVYGGEIGNFVWATRDSFKLGLKSAGSVVKLLEMISGNSRINGKVGFSINRPPGHHSSRDVTEGFCIFNNIAIGIEYLRKIHNYNKKIAIIDIDTHFGNGTSALYYQDPDILHLSIHESNFKGSVGMANEIGAKKGRGTNINYRVPLGAYDEIWLRALKIFEQIIKQFKPSLIIVAAGFDGHWTDPMGNLNLTSNAYKKFGEWIKELSEDVCEGRVGFVLEGGYSNLMLGRLVISLITPFLPDDFIPEAPIDLLIPHSLAPDIEEIMERQLNGQEQTLKAILEPKWSINI